MMTEEYEMQEINLLCPELYKLIQDCLPSFIEGLWDTEIVYISVEGDEFKVSWEQRGNMVDVHFNQETDSPWLSFDEAPGNVAEEVQNLF